VFVRQRPGDDKRGMRVWDAGKKTFSDSECKLRGRRPLEEGALVGQGYQACQRGWRPRRVPNGVMGQRRSRGRCDGVGDGDGG
jgi:hypothetical protein